MTEKMLKKWFSKMKKLKKDYEANMARLSELDREYWEILKTPDRSKILENGRESGEIERKNEELLQTIFEEFGNQKPFGLLLDFINCKDEAASDGLLENAVFSYFAGPGAEDLPGAEEERSE